MRAHVVLGFLLQGEPLPSTVATAEGEHSFCSSRSSGMTWPMVLCLGQRSSQGFALDAEQNPLLFSHVLRYWVRHLLGVLSRSGYHRCAIVPCLGIQSPEFSCLGCDICATFFSARPCRLACPPSSWRLDFLTEEVLAVQQPSTAFVE